MPKLMPRKRKPKQSDPRAPLFVRSGHEPDGFCVYRAGDGIGYAIYRHYHYKWRDENNRLGLMAGWSKGRRTSITLGAEAP